MSNSYSYHKAGRLVCDRRRGRLPGALSDHPEYAMDRRIARRKSSRSSITRLSPKRLIGCCPPGDRYGTPYKVGSGCCTHEIFDVSTHFCCRERGRYVYICIFQIDCKRLYIYIFHLGALWSIYGFYTVENE